MVSDSASDAEVVHTTLVQITEDAKDLATGQLRVSIGTACSRCSQAFEEISSQAHAFYTVKVIASSNQAAAWTHGYGRVNGLVDEE